MAVKSQRLQNPLDSAMLLNWSIGAVVNLVGLGFRGHPKYQLRYTVPLIQRVFESLAGRVPSHGPLQQCSHLVIGFRHAKHTAVGRKFDLLLVSLNTGPQFPHRILANRGPAGYSSGT